MMLARRYERRGLLAIEPRALFESFFVDDTQKRDVAELGDCAVVDVRGPLENHAHAWCDSYEDILGRVQAACATSARAVVLRLDSPGGDAHGCFETALAIRAACDAAGKPLLGYVEGECASAAYALASQCHSITIAISALVGSIGVLSSREDITAMNAARGLRVALVMSGSRKGDGHPDMPITDAELANTQSIVDSMAAVFFDLVAQGRGLKPVAVAQLQARVFHGEAAVQVGLADAVGSLTTVLATASPAGGTRVMAKKMSFEELRDALAAAAEGTDPNAKAAKRALAVMDEAEPAEAEGGETEETAEGEMPEETAEGETPETDEEGKPKPAAKRAEGGEEEKTATSTATAAYRMALKAQTESAQLRAQLKQRDEAAERQQLIASRPDLPTDTISLLARAPMALVREHIAGLPPLKGEAASTVAGGLKNPRMVAYGKPLTGNPEPAGASHLPAAEKAELDQRMGLSEAGLHVVANEYKLTLGAYRPR